MTLSKLAIAAFSWAMLNGAYASADKDRVRVEARWYTEAYVKEHLKTSDPKLLRSAFHPSATFLYAGDASGFKPQSANLLSEPLPTRKGDFVRLPLEQPGASLAEALDKQCVEHIAMGLRSLRQGARQRAVRQLVKDVVVDGIQSGELASAPQDLDRSAGRKIVLFPPKGEKKLLCNIYKTHRSGHEVYDISVVLVASAAYAVPGR
ncbi:hypothetical protein [Pseudomonas sp. H9]|uniref:hypothetical protein n=1 Tax=Pseudomonas sp. H9 TaxID=483968 RepID=UPI001057B393|nr:hypothetical protein [Pseudomonas sp. H9]TDF84388.1 hypothetical protein E1573_07610 [Pseudomonas sp. H9]